MIDIDAHDLISYIDSIPELIKNKRSRSNISFNMAANEIGIKWDTLKRIETVKDYTYTVESLRKIINWLGKDF